MLKMEVARSSEMALAVHSSYTLLKCRKLMWKRKVLSVSGSGNSDYTNRAVPLGSRPAAVLFVNVATAISV